VTENLLSDAWTDLDQADLRLLLQARIGRPGQYDGDSDVLYLPLARDKCKVALTYKSTKIIAIKPGAAFDQSEWERICAEIETSLLNGPQKVGREFSFNTFRVCGWWRGERSGVQILPPPDGAPHAPVEIADHPFILEFPIAGAPDDLWQITNHRRIREHQQLTRLLNLLLAGTSKFLPGRNRHFWACVQFQDEPEIKWVQEWYFATLGEVVANQLSSPAGDKLGELDSEKYCREVGHDGDGLRVPDDLDDLICRYQNLPSPLRAKFDRATYWMSMASHQWEHSMSASFASLVSAVEALTEEGSKHILYCDTCKKECVHDAPGATEKFRIFFEKYTPDPGLKKRRNEMYRMRSMILHGSELMQLDQNRAFDWDPPWWNERELHSELWSLMRIATRSWLKTPPAG
jgi:hypothetical protein